MRKATLFTVVHFACFLIAAHGQKITWTSVFTPGFAIVNDAAFGKGKYVAVGQDGTILHSTNGKTWSKGKLPDGLSCNLNTVAFAFGKFWAGGVNLANNRAVLLLSLDGVNWSNMSSGFASAVSNWHTVDEIHQLLAYSGTSGQVLIATTSYGEGDGRFLAFTSEGSVWKRDYYSADDIFQARDLIYFRTTYNDWSDLSYSPDSWNGWSTGNGDAYQLPDDLRRFVYANSYYVGVGPEMKIGYWNGVTDNNNYYGNQFTYAISPVISDFTGIAYGAGAYVASGNNGALIESYDNGKSWFKVSLKLGAITLSGVKFVGGKFLAFGGGRIITGDPVPQRTWRAVTLTSRPERITALATNGKVVVAVGDKGQIHYSYNGTVWKKAAPITSNDLYSIDYDKSSKAFYATGAAGTLLRSVNGVDWTLRKSNTTDWLFGVSRADQTLVAAGAGGAYLTSRDGISWTSHPAGTIGEPGRVVGFGGRVGFVQNLSVPGGSSGQVWINKDGGSRWTKLKSPAPTTFNDAAVLNSSIFLAGANGNLYSSPLLTVGLSWSRVSTRTQNAILGLAENSSEGGQLTAVGNEGMVFTLRPNGQWRNETIFEGTPLLWDAIRFKNLWIVAGQRGGFGFVAFTSQN